MAKSSSDATLSYNGSSSALIFIPKSRTKKKRKKNLTFNIITLSNTYY